MTGYDPKSHYEIAVFQAAKRCGVQHTPTWMGDCRWAAA